MVTRNGQKHRKKMADGRIEKDDIVNQEAIEQINGLKQSINDAADALTQIILGVNATSEALGNQVKATQALNDAEQLLNDLHKQASDLNAKIKQDYNDLTDAEKQLLVEKRNTSAESKAQLEMDKQQDIVNNTQLGTIERLIAQNKVWVAERKSLNLETSEGRDRLKEINEMMDKNNEFIKSNMDATTKQRMEVGNYSGALDKLVPGLGSTINGIEGATKASLAFIATPLGMVLGAIGLALGSLIAYFKGSEEGQNNLNKVMMVGKAIWEVLEKLVASVGKIIWEAITKPKEALQELGEFLENQVINRFKAWGVVGHAIVEILSGNLKKGFHDLADGALQGLTGVTNVIEKVTDGVNKMATEIDAKAKLAMKLADDIAARDKEERENEVEMAKLKMDAAKLNQEASEKDKLSTEERLAMKQKAMDVEKQVMEINLQDAKRDLDIAKEKMAIEKEDKEHLEEVAKATAKLYDVQTEYYSGTKRLASQMATFRLQIEKEHLDDVKTGFEAEKIDIEANIELLKTAQDKKRDEINATLVLQLETYKKELDATDIKEKEKLKIQAEYDKLSKVIAAENTKYTTEQAKLLVEEKTRQYDLDVKRFGAAAQDETNAAKIANDQILKDKLAQLKATIEASNLNDAEKKKALDKITAYEIDLDKKTTDDIKKNLKDREAAQKAFTQDAIDMSKDIMNFSKAMDDRTLQNAQDKATKEKNILDKSLADKTAALEDAKTKELAQANLTSEQKTAIDKKYSDAEKQLSTDTANSKTKIDQDYQIKSAEVKRKQAIIDKAASLADIGIKTAQGVMAVASTGGGTWYADLGISAGILEDIVIALGVAQAAAVVAQPLPEIPSFKKGGKHSGGLVWLHGGELVSLPSGEEFLTPGGVNDPILANLPDKTNVTPNDILLRELNNIQKISTDKNANKENGEIIELARAIKDKKELYINIDSHGLQIFTSQGLSRTNYINKMYRGKINV